jgi:Tfp pilus assembly protein PilV
MARRISYQRGATLVEVFISLAIFTAVMLAVSTFEVSIYQNQQTLSGSFSTAQDAQTVLKTMLTELREAAPGGNGAYPIVAASTSTLSFFADPLHTGTTEEITYTLASSTLYRAVILPSGSPVSYPSSGQSTSTLITNVRNGTSTPLFQYFDQNYSGTSTPLSLPISVSSVRLVDVSVTLDTNPRTAPAPRTYTVQVSLRNLKTNL